MLKTKKIATKKSKSSAPTKLTKVKNVGDITEYILERNGLRILHKNMKGTGTVTTNIVYKVGSRDEARGATGIAHMLEHMLFKPTTFDRTRKTKSGAMHFESETGATTNANTYKDRTTYYFSYPKEHFERALTIEAERMRGVVLTDAEFKPEQANVLSEYDMYAGDEHFILSIDLIGAAFFSHPYGVETIGFREDIAMLTTAKLRDFYDIYYRPNNATLTIIGDITFKELEPSIHKVFGSLERGPDLHHRTYPVEPVQTGLRTVTVEKKSKTNILGIGAKHSGFPSKPWFETMIIFDLLAGGKDSILHKKLVNSGKAVSVDSVLEPLSDQGLGIIFVTLADGYTHERIEKEILSIIKDLTVKEITPYIKKTCAKILTEEAFTRESSLSYTAELVEYVSSGDWTQFFTSEEILKTCTPKQIFEYTQRLFSRNNMTLGYFIGKDS